MRYLPASTCPISWSSWPDRFNTAPSKGHSVFVSAYCLSHVGHVFIYEIRPRLRNHFQGIELERITPLSRGAMLIAETGMSEMFFAKCLIGVNRSMRGERVCTSHADKSIMQNASAY